MKTSSGLDQQLESVNVVIVISWNQQQIGLDTSECEIFSNTSRRGARAGIAGT